MTKSELEILFKTHYAAMYRLAMSFLYDVDEARDVVSDVFAQLHAGVQLDEVAADGGAQVKDAAIVLAQPLDLLLGDEA